MNTNSIILQNIDTEGLKTLIREVNAEMFAAIQPKPQPKDKYITRREVADKISISLPTLNEYTKTGKLKAYRIGGRVLYKESEVEAALIEKYRRT